MANQQRTPGVAGTPVPGRLVLHGSLAWVTATVGGACLGVVIGSVISWVLSLPIMLLSQSAGPASMVVTGAQSLAGAAMLAIVAAGIATGQAVVLDVWLSSYIRRPWIIATAISWVAASLVVGLVQRWVTGPWIFLALMLVFGAAIGFGQLLVLRRYIARPALWVPISAVSLMAAEAISLTGMGSSILIVAASALIYGALSGPGIVWLVLSDPRIRQAVEEASAPPPDATA